MTRSVELYFSPVSPFSYLGHDRLRAICARHGARVEPRLIDLGKVFPASGGVALKDRAPQRRAYRLVELARWSRHLGIPLNLEPKHFPVPAELAARTILGAAALAGDAAALDLAGDLMRAIWAEDRDVSDPDTLAAVVAARGLDPVAVLDAARGEASAARYAQHTAEAIERGVFGSPTYVVGGELYWGQDRLDFVERALAAPGG